MKALKCLSLGLLAIFGSVSASLLAVETTYYFNDPLATTIGTSDAAGEIAAMEADAFGAPIAAGHAPSRYTGKPYDEDLGAYVFPFRNYRAQEARWMSADPSGFPDGVNGQWYAPMPLTQIDSLGLVVQFIPITDADSGITSFVSSAQQQVFHATMQQIQQQGPEGQMLYAAVYDPSIVVQVSNTPGEIPTGAGGVVNGMLIASISLDFTAEAFVDPSLAGSYVNQIGSAKSTLAHELGHGIYQFSDPENVVWENYFRPVDNQRTQYRDMIITEQMMLDMHHRVNALVSTWRNHQE